MAPLKIQSSGLLHGLGLGAIAGGRGAEDVGAQVVARDSAVGNIFDGAAMFGWNIQPFGYTLLT